jgi:hypothetical protein
MLRRRCVTRPRPREQRPKARPIARTFGLQQLAAKRPDAALWLMVTATAAILSAIILFPRARELSDFGPLHGDEVTVVLASGLIALPLLELAKRLVQPWSSVCRQHIETVNRCTQ